MRTQVEAQVCTAAEDNLLAVGCGLSARGRLNCGCRTGGSTKTRVLSAALVGTALSSTMPSKNAIPLTDVTVMFVDRDFVLQVG